MNSDRARDALVFIGRVGGLLVNQSVNTIAGEAFDALRVRAYRLFVSSGR